MLICKRCMMYADCVVGCAGVVAMFVKAGVVTCVTEYVVDVTDDD